jgi:1,4-dihydroxy-2-naphthoyl-CoA hydrolase
MTDPILPGGLPPAGALMAKLGMEFVEAGPERVVARMPVEGNTQPLGLLHGGASAALAETVASFGGWLVDPSRMVVGLELKINHLRPARDGWLTATGLPVHIGRTTQLWEIRIVNDEGRLVAFSTCTLAVRSATT